MDGAVSALRHLLARFYTLGLACFVALEFRRRARRVRLLAALGTLVLGIVNVATATYGLVVAAKPVVPHDPAAAGNAWGYIETIVPQFTPS